MTNLIEQLGGYEKAKGIFILNDDDYEFYSPHFEYYSEKAVHDDSLDIKNIEHVLLEHRRQHNIFEVGDGVSHPIFSSIFTIDKVQSYSVLATTNTGYHTSLKTELIRHATDKEIAQGYQDES